VGLAGFYADPFLLFFLRESLIFICWFIPVLIFGVLPAIFSLGRFFFFFGLSDCLRFLTRGSFRYGLLNLPIFKRALMAVWISGQGQPGGVFFLMQLLCFASPVRLVFFPQFFVSSTLAPLWANSGNCYVSFSPACSRASTFITEGFIVPFPIGYVLLLFGGVFLSIWCYLNRCFLCRTPTSGSFPDLFFLAF